MPAYDAILSAPMSPLGACFSNDVLTRLDFLAQDTATTSKPDSRARQLADDLDAYWDNPAHRFSVRLAPQGTPFQLRVWHALMRIPAGHPTTYGALAKQLGTAARAVGQACGANRLPILIPCHRVVAANGVGGFMHASAGAALDVKTWLLAHERSAASGSRFPLPNPDGATKQSTKPASGQVAAYPPACGRGSERDAHTD